MRTLLSLGLLLLLSDRGAETELVFAPRPGTVLARTFEAHAEYELTEVELSVNGEPYEGGGELPELTMEFDEHVAVTDKLDEVEDGRPTSFERTYDRLHQTTTFSDGENEQESDSVSDLEGRTLRYSFEDDEWTIEAGDDGDDPGDEQAEWLLEDMDLRGLLPDHEVEEGDSWEVGPEPYLAFMWPGGLIGWRGEEDEEAGDEAMNIETIENLDGSGTVTLEELREEDGVRVAVLHVVFEVETSCDDEGDLENGSYEREIEIERSLEGTVLWDLEHGHALSAELEGTGTRLTTQRRSLEAEGETLELEQAELFEGTVTYSATFERR